MAGRSGFGQPSDINKQAAKALVPARVDAAVKERATAILHNDPSPAVPHDQMEAHFAERRAAALQRVGEDKA